MHRCALLVVLVAVLLVAGCTPGGSPASAPSAVRVMTSGPSAPVTVVADADPVAATVSASRALFALAPVVVVVGNGDRPGMLLGASTAVALGVPLLVRPAAGSDAAVGAELDRLHATDVLAIGAAAGGDLAGSRRGGGPPPRTVVAVPADARAIADAAGVRLGPVRSVPDGGDVAAVAALSTTEPVALQPLPAAAAGGSARAGNSGGSVRPSGSGQAGSGEQDRGRLPAVRRGRPLQGTLVLAAGGAASVAGVATARAAGARVQLTGGSADPRASAAVIENLKQTQPRSVVALGDGFAAEGGLDWKLATARAGRQLPGGGQLLFPGRTLVALYGTPGSAALGVLGEQDAAGSVYRAQDMATTYAGLLHTPIVPAFEIIATVASSAPGPDGNYSSEADPATLRPWIDAAEQAGLYVVLDLQPGRADFLTQAKLYQSLLERPNVGLALDPEWRLAPNQLPLRQIGSVDVAEINRVITWLADLTRAEALPQKLFVVHQFQLRMISDRQQLDTSRDELAVMIHADGQGTQPMKQDTWRVLHEDLPPGPLHWGWKNFIDEDHPMLTPPQTVFDVRPFPDLITYQ